MKPACRAALSLSLPRRPSELLREQPNGTTILILPAGNTAALGCAPPGCWGGVNCAVESCCRLSSNVQTGDAPPASAEVRSVPPARGTLRPIVRAAPAIRPRNEFPTAVVHVGAASIQPKAKWSSFVVREPGASCCLFRLPSLLCCLCCASSFLLPHAFCDGFVVDRHS